MGFLPGGIDMDLLNGDVALILPCRQSCIV